MSTSAEPDEVPDGIAAFPESSGRRRLDGLFEVVASRESAEPESRLDDAIRVLEMFRLRNYRPTGTTDRWFLWNWFW